MRHVIGKSDFEAIQGTSNPSAECAGKVRMYLVQRLGQ